jgi:hypothetical protein
MSLETQSIRREHHFYVAIAKFLFHHPEHGIVAVGDPIKIKDAARFGLSPLILYGLTVAGLPIRWLTFTPMDQPRAFQDVLLDAWRNAEGLRGQPATLRINRHLATASPGLVGEMEKIGVQVEIADAKEKSLPASLRAAQDASRWLLRKFDANDRSLTQSMQALCRHAQDKHNFDARNSRGGVSSRRVADGIRQWLALPVRDTVLTVPGELDWEPGPWLATWEAALPPAQPRYFHRDEHNGETWLLIDEGVAGDSVEEDDNLWAASDCDNAAEIAKNLVACWPNPTPEIARCVGVTTQQLQWFLSGRATLPQHSRFELESLLSIEFDENVGMYVEAGPYVLVAHKPQAIKAVYESISGGGAAGPCEIVPHQGAADPSWRYVLICTSDQPVSIVMAPRGAKITEQLPALFLNYDGIKTVRADFYRDVVSTCARACREPTANIREMNDFASRYEAQWINCAWVPE